MKLDKQKPVFIKYLITFLVASGLFFLTISVRDIYTLTDTKEIYRALSDGFSVPGVVLIAFGALLWLSNNDAFHGIGYAVKHLFVMLIPVMRKKHETYADYLETRKKVKGFGFIFIIGSAFLLFGIIFMLLFLK